MNPWFGGSLKLLVNLEKEPKELACSPSLPGTDKTGGSVTYPGTNRLPVTGKPGYPRSASSFKGFILLCSIALLWKGSVLMISRELALSEQSISSLILGLKEIYEHSHPITGLSLVQRLKARDVELEIEEAMEHEATIRARW